VNRSLHFSVGQFLEDSRDATTEALVFLVATVGPGYALATCSRLPLSRGLLLGGVSMGLVLLFPELDNMGSGIYSGCGTGRRAIGFCWGAVAQLTLRALGQWLAHK
jgi:hypothetical protein